MRKLNYIIAAVTITAMVITGCSSSDTSKTEDNSTTTTTTQEAENSSSTTTAIQTGIVPTSQIEVDKEFTARDLEVGYEESTAITITLKDKASTVSGSGAEVKDNTITINSEGTYVISGTLSEGQIVVEAADTEKVQLVLKGVTIHNSTSAAIYIKSGDKVFITLEEGTVNTLTDGTEYVQTDDNTVDGVIFSKADLTFNGSGTLNLTASYKHGIVSKDDVVVTGGIYNITAVKDAINGKDAVKIKAGTFTLSSDTGNGIQSKNADDTTKGYVYIAGGTITVVKCQEGIEGTVIIIDDGVINITASDDGMNAASGSNDTSETDGTENGFPQDGENMTPPEDGSFPGPGSTDDNGNTASGDTASTGTAPAGRGPQNNTTDTSGTSDTSGTTNTSAKADSTDATSEATENSQNADGQENNGQERPQNPGNFGGGNFGGGGGMDQVDTNCYILINGGTITVDASGDGIDSNGDLYITGGTLYVYGPTGNGDGALDYNGTADISGGNVYVAGSSGMAQGFSDTSTQYSILYNLTSVSTAGTEVTLKDSSGKVVASFTPTKDYQSIVLSLPELTKDATYTLTSGEQTADITLSSVVTSNGQQGMGGRGGFGGGTRK
ncbi:carbohydrate-binding domain-containing protein [Anaerocolumna sp. AGMB13020]|uniref:carbohydrate-binding domain-containing protein n=1 Tax=Anaerocolumna sp. AGMB13020 TaxID=3081750 RepID=UPI002952E3D4|nr:carbohydrate-binding domain-containing protein [Anaerocolumna sp. AGMB13020]WOO35637.1 carbohydrate-binding domain-containing protein [Anaerocolumna sp. AGMB13020]